MTISRSKTSDSLWRNWPLLAEVLLGGSALYCDLKSMSDPPKQVTTTSLLRIFNCSIIHLSNCS